MATTKSITNALGWTEPFYSVAFQSRFGRQPWIRPYLDQHIKEQVKAGNERLALVTPSFVSDCLETIHEIGIEYREQFIKAGGEEFLLLPNLNDDQTWMNAVFEIAKKHLDGTG